VVSFPRLPTQSLYRGAVKSLPLPGRKQAQKHVRDARDFNNIETRAVTKFLFFLQGKAPKEIHAILTETLACFLPVRVNTGYNPHVMCTVNNAVTNEMYRVQFSGYWIPSSTVTLIFQLHSKLQVTVRDTSAGCDWSTRQLVTPHIARAIKISRDHIRA